jgi:hypothetical protein
MDNKKKARRWSGMEDYKKAGSKTNQLQGKKRKNRKKVVDYLPENKIISSKISKFGKGFKIPNNKTNKRHKGEKLEKNGV